MALRVPGALASRIRRVDSGERYLLLGYYTRGCAGRARRRFSAPQAPSKLVDAGAPARRRRPRQPPISGQPLPVTLGVSGARLSLDASRLLFRGMIKIGLPLEVLIIRQLLPLASRALRRLTGDWRVDDRLDAADHLLSGAPACHRLYRYFRPACHERKSLMRQPACLFTFSSNAHISRASARHRNRARNAASASRPPPHFAPPRAGGRAPPPAGYRYPPP